MKSRPFWPKTNHWQRSTPNWKTNLKNCRWILREKLLLGISLMLILRDCENFLFSRTSGKPYLSGAATLTYKAVNSMAKFCLKTHSLSILKGTCTELFNLQWIINPNLLSKCNGHALRKDLVRSKSLLIEFLDTYYVLKSCALLKDFLLRGGA